jgi:hypothetical protein
VPSFSIWILGPLKNGPIGCPETSARNYRYSLHNNPEQRSSVTRFVGSCVSVALHRCLRGMCRLQIMPDNVGIIFLRNVGNVLPDYTVSHHRKPQCCRGGSRYKLQGPGGPKGGSVPDYARMFFWLFSLVSDVIRWWCTVLMALAACFVSVIFFTRARTRSRRPWTFTRSIDTAAISYSPSESSWPCFEKPGNKFFDPDLVTWRWNEAAGRTDCRPRGDIRPGIPTLHEILEGWCKVLHYLPLTGAQTTGKSSWILMIKWPRNCCLASS